MKKLALCVVVMFACSKKSEDKPADPPKPVEPAPEAPKPEAPKPEAPKPEATTECVVKIHVAKNGEPDLSATKGAKPECSANITADAEVPYQKIITTMDTVIKNGIANIEIGDGERKPAPKPSTGLAPEVKIEGGWKNGKLEGKIVDNPDRKSQLQKAPVIILTKTEAKLGDKAISKLPSATLTDDVAKAMAPNPTDPYVIILADADTPYSTLSAAIAGAEKSGYSEVLFAVKNK